MATSTRPPRPRWRAPGAAECRSDRELAARHAAGRICSEKLRSPRACSTPRSSRPAAHAVRSIVGNHQTDRAADPRSARVGCQPRHRKFHHLRVWSTSSAGVVATEWRLPGVDLLVCMEARDGAERCGCLRGSARNQASGNQPDRHSRAHGCRHFLSGARHGVRIRAGSEVARFSKYELRRIWLGAPYARRILGGGTGLELELRFKASRLTPNLDWRRRRMMTTRGSITVSRGRSRLSRLARSRASARLGPRPRRRSSPRRRWGSGWGGGLGGALALRSQAATKRCYRGWTRGLP